MKKDIFIIYLILSLMIIIPFQISNVSAGSIVTKKEANSACFGNPLENPKNSLVLSVLTLCLPGILEKINDYQQIRCQEIVCQYEAVKIGVDPTFCAKQKGYQTCTQITGEIFNLPFLNTIKMIKDAISNLLSNPNPGGLLWSIGAIAARKYVTAACTTSTIACKSPFVGTSAIFLAVTDLLAVAQILSDIMENGLFGDDDNPYCDDVDNIVSELEQITKVNEVNVE